MKNKAVSIGNDGADAKPYQERDVFNALNQLEEIQKDQEEN